MVEHTRNDDEAESFDLTVRCPGVAFDMGQKGFPRTLVVQKLADSVTEYDAGRGDGEKGQLGYLKNALVGATGDDAVYQCVYLTDNPVGRGELNDPKTRYPVPESRLVPFRADKADPVDNSPQWSPRESVQSDTLESLFDVAHAFSDAPDADELETMAEHAGFNSDVVQSAREAADVHAETLEVTDELSVEHDGPDMELKQVGDGDADDAPETTPVGGEADGESETDDEPPEPPDDDPDGVDDLDDEQLGDFDPDDV